ncbi:MAG: hypothetical protein WB607_10845 [Candidatus Acidiferrum sp.]|jgi:hypothetical protein
MARDYAAGRFDRSVRLAHTIKPRIKAIREPVQVESAATNK